VTLGLFEHITGSTRAMARMSIVVALSGVALGLLAIAMWSARNSEAATVQNVVVAAPSARLVQSKRAATPIEISDNALPSKVTRMGNVIVWHPLAVEADGSYDVIIHFHGVQLALEPAMREARLRAVLIIVNDGLMAESYRDGHGAPGTLDRLLLALHTHVAKAFNRDDVHTRRVAVSAWSAGFGAVAPMLRREADVARLDAVLVSDGLHSAFTDPKRRLVADSQLDFVVNFAKRAIGHDKLFGITHTAIQTPDFASTTETAQKLLGLLAMTPDMILDADQGRAPVLTSVAERGDFVLLGYDGNDKHAHAVQQWALGRTLWSRLAERWNH